METVLHLIDSTAIMATLALVYGVVMRLKLPSGWKDGFLGAALGLGAIATMLQPIFQMGNVIIDCRALFTGFAGAFLGWRGALIALIVASCGRLAINVSPAAFFGILGMAIAVSAGRAWQAIEARIGSQVSRLAVLGGLISLSCLPLFLVPELKGSSAPMQSSALLTLYNLVGSLVLGSFLHREKAQADREASALRAAFTDPLTGVLNRRGFSSGFTTTEARPTSRGSAMLMIDLDFFKSVNDSYGHAAGDQVLKLTGERIRHAIRPQDLVLRAGGEEFGVLLADIDASDARALAERIRTTLAMPCQLSDSRNVSVTASVGGFCWPTGLMSERDATARADGALYQAKADGRDRAVFH